MLCTQILKSKKVNILASLRISQRVAHAEGMS